MEQVEEVLLLFPHAAIGSTAHFHCYILFLYTMPGQHGIFNVDMNQHPPTPTFAHVRLPTPHPPPPPFLFITIFIIIIV